jgi:hypothetical protein
MVWWVRSVVAVAVAVVVFFGCLWVFVWLSWSWLPHAQADRWVVATGLATVTGGSVFAVLGSWAERSRSEPGSATTSAGAGVYQRATARGRARVTQVGGDQHVGRGESGD